jgi:hypothetical protein
MPRGAPQGNQYAKKARHERGITFSYYLDVYEYDFLKKSVEYDGNEPTDENIRAKVKKLTKEAIRQDMIATFAHYKQDHHAPTL